MGRYGEMWGDVGIKDILNWLVRLTTPRWRRFLIRQVRLTTQMETQMVNVERLFAFGRLQPEEPPASGTAARPRPPVGWPGEGRIQFEACCMAYREELPTVLNGFTLSVGAAEKVGARADQFITTSVARHCALLSQVGTASS